MTTARLIYLALPKAVVSFTATGTVLSSINERQASQRKGLVRRLLSWSMAGYFAYVVAGLATLGLVAGRRQSNQSTGAVVRLVESVFKVSVPLRYMVFPPTVAERRDLLEKDELGVYRPKNKYRLKVSRRITWVDVAEVATLLALDWM